MPCPSHPPWLHHSNYVWWGVQGHLYPDFIKLK
jgi:hypothetical protein